MILLYWIALLLFAFFGVVNFFFLWASTGKYPKGYFLQTAYNIDCFANREFRALWNGTLITSEGYKFGNPKQTLSEVLGMNYVIETLTPYGRLTVFLLSENHCLKAIGHPIIKVSFLVKLARLGAWLIFPLLYIFATPQPLRIAFFGVLAGTFGKLCNVYNSDLYLHIGLAFVFMFAFDLLWWIIKSLIK